MTKLKRGNCGTCHWFERGPQQPPRDQPWQGSCLVNPPVPFLTAQQTQTLGPQGPQALVQPVTMSLLPGTDESRRCRKWQPAGVVIPDVFEEHKKLGEMFDEAIARGRIDTGANAGIGDGSSKSSVNPRETPTDTT